MPKRLSEVSVDIINVDLGTGYDVTSVTVENSNPQITLKRSDGGLNLLHKVVGLSDYYVQNTSGNGTMNFEVNTTGGSGGIFMRPTLATKTEMDFQVEVGNGATFDVLTNTNETSHTCNVPASFTDSTISYTDPSSGSVVVTGTSSALNGLYAGSVSLPAGLVNLFRFLNVGLQSSVVTDNTTAASGTLTETVTSSVAGHTIAASNTNVTCTNASSFVIAGAPVAGTNVTITNPYAMWIKAGVSRFDGYMLPRSGTEASLTGSPENALAVVTDGDLGTSLAFFNSSTWKYVPTVQKIQTTYVLPAALDSGSLPIEFILNENTVTVSFGGVPYNPSVTGGAATLSAQVPAPFRPLTYNAYIPTAMTRNSAAEIALIRITPAGDFSIMWKDTAAWNSVWTAGWDFQIFSGGGTYQVAL